MVKQFSRGGGKVEFFKEVEIFREGFKLLLERWNWNFLMKGVLEVTSREFFCEKDFIEKSAKKLQLFT